QDISERVLPEAVSVLASFESSFNDEFQKYAQAVKDLEKQNKLFEFYKAVLDRLTKMYLDSLSLMLSDVYRTAYNTDSKQIQLQMVDFRNKKVIRLNVVNHVDGHDFLEPFDTQGGSTHVLLGLIVSIYFILTTGAPRIIFIDESLSALHQDVFFRFMGILRQFVDQLGFVFVVVDHHAEWFKDFAEKVYVIDNGVYRESSFSELDL
ncbi:MAG: ABC transporter ATP-binding protein, partial [Treponema sp.]|nr:ABC transporter ATP-binding protein [Treponema sp.]